MRALLLALGLGCATVAAQATPLAGDQVLIGVICNTKDQALQVTQRRIDLGYMPSTLPSGCRSLNHLDPAMRSATVLEIVEVVPSREGLVLIGEVLREGVEHGYSMGMSKFLMVEAGDVRSG